MRSLCNHNCFTICEQNQPLEQCFTKMTAGDPYMDHPEKFFGDMRQPEVIERLENYDGQVIDHLKAMLADWSNQKKLPYQPKFLKVCIKKMLLSPPPRPRLQESQVFRDALEGDRYRIQLHLRSEITTANGRNIALGQYQHNQFSIESTHIPYWSYPDSYHELEAGIWLERLVC